MGAFKYFVGIIVLQLFYAFGITVLSHSLIAINPSISSYLGEYENISVDMNEIATSVEGTLNSQMNIPVVDLGALVFYSGNIMVDLIMNFFFAVPSMFSLLVNGILKVFMIDAFNATYIKEFAYIFISVLYFINIVAFIINIRSRGSIV